MVSKVVSLDAWKGQLDKNANGTVKKSMTNLMLCLKGTKEIGKTVRWNELAQQPEWNGRPINEDMDIVDFRLIIESKGCDPIPRDVMPAIIRLARDNSYHPVRDYLNSLKWDGIKRLDYWLNQCLGAADTPFNRAIGRKTLIAAVARSFRPGCKVDTVLVLEGPQGLKKSTAIAALFSEAWTAESVNLFDQHNKMVLAMTGAWCVELAEFVAFQRRDENTVKGLLSMRADRVVLPYARHATDHPRQCIFFGTINPDDVGYLTGGTGNRRYWPVEVTKMDIDLILARRDQIWSEAVVAYQGGEKWWLEDDEHEAMAADAVSEREEFDAWEETLAYKLAGLGSVNTTEALEMIGFRPEHIDRRAQVRIGKVLRRLGFEMKFTRAEGSRRPIRVWVKAP